MILGIGTDLVTIARINDSWLRFGDKFAEKILSAAELAHFAQLEQPGLFLAGRFAAKEALAKALGTGMRNGIWFSHFSVVADKLGKPTVTFTHAALARAEELGVVNAHLTITHEETLVLAFAVVEGEVATDG